MKNWINTISREHVHLGVAGGFTQAGHGKRAPLQRLRRDDLIVFYSPRTALDAGEALQRFTAIGRIADEEPFQVQMSPDFHPWRRKVHFLTAAEAPIQPLIPALEFIQKRSNWGFSFRRGLFEITPADMATIADAMKANLR
jgi:hypothetical protein